MATSQVRTAVSIKKEIDRTLIPILNTHLGSRLIKYVNMQTIEADARSVVRVTPANFVINAPDLLRTDPAGMGGTQKSFEISPTSVYSFEIITYEQMRQIGTINTETWFIKSLSESIDISKDIMIIRAIEEHDSDVKLSDRYWDGTGKGTNGYIFEEENIEKFKQFLVYAATRYVHPSQARNAKAVCCIHRLDWSSILLRNDFGNIFSSNEYIQVTDVNGIMHDRLCGCALEVFDDLPRDYGDPAFPALMRNYIIKSGQVRIFANGNIEGAQWEGSTRTEVTESIANLDSTRIIVAKSMGFKVIEPIGLYLMDFTQRPLNA